MISNGRGFFLCALLICQQTSWAGEDRENDDPMDKIVQIEAGRKATHASASQQMATLNYFRMKLQVIDTSTTKINAALVGLNKPCSPETFDSNVCKAGVDSLYLDVQEQIYRITLFATSDRFKLVMGSPFNTKLRLDELLNQRSDRLHKFSAQLLELRKKVGLESARIEFASSQRSVRVAKEDFAKRASCSLTLPTLTGLFVSAEADFADADKKNDGYLIRRGLSDLTEVQDKLAWLERNCQDAKTETLRKETERLDVASLESKIPKLFKSGCTKVRLDDAELRDACSNDFLNDEMLLALHSALERTGAGK